MIEHYHIFILKEDAEGKRSFVNEKFSTDRNSLYTEFKTLHNRQPDNYRFAWCNAEECLIEEAITNKG